MSAVYSDIHVEVEAGRNTIRISFRLENRTSETWRPNGGFRVGSQILDPETNAFIQEGAAVAPAVNVSPGQSVLFSFSVELPPVRGAYRILISPMQAESFWYYDRSWQFVLIDATVGKDRTSVVRSRLTTMESLRREARRGAITKVFVYPFRSMWCNRSLIRSMVRRDIVGRYRGSFAGTFWTLLNPLLLMLTYFFVFGIVLRTRFGNDPSRWGFVLYFLAGMLPWLPFSEAAGRAPLLILDYRNFVKKLVFPIETLPVNLTLAGLVTEAFALVIFLGLLLVARGRVPASVLWLPVILVPQVLFTMGLCWFLAALGAYVRDIGQVIGFLLTLWFFLTPICYPEASLPAAALNLLSVNPFFVLVRAYRAVFLEGAAPAWGPMWKLWIVSAAVFLAGHAWFHKLRKSFADVI